MRKQILGRTVSSDFFNQEGPFRSKLHENLTITLSPFTKIETDFYESKTATNAPLGIIIHGNGYNRLAHRDQAKRIASWGIHSLVVDLPNRNQWNKNGIRVKSLAKLIHSYPQILSRKIDHTRIFLIGHSFGGSASAIAAGNGAPVKGLILLDPAVLNPKIKEWLKLIKIPTVIIGADKNVFTSKKRWQFFKYLSGPVAEVSIIGSTHTDAQLPSIIKVHWGFDVFRQEVYQERFLSSIIVSLLSLSLTKGLKFAWKIFHSDINKGLMKKGRVKFQQRKRYHSKKSSAFSKDIKKRPN